MVGFKRFRLVGEAAPVEGFRPADLEDVAGEPCHGADSLLKLPGREVGAMSECLKEFQCGWQVVQGDSGDPGLCPAQIIGSCLGQDISSAKQLLIGGKKIDGFWLWVNHRGLCPARPRDQDTLDHKIAG